MISVCTYSLLYMPPLLFFRPLFFPFFLSLFFYFLSFFPITGWWDLGCILFRVIFRKDISTYIRIQLVSA